MSNSSARGASALEGDDLAQPLQRVDHVGVEIAEVVAGAGAQAVDDPPGEQRAQRGEQQQRREPEPEPPIDEKHGDQSRAGHHDGDDDVGDGVGEEVLDRLDVLRSHRDEVAAAAAQQVGRREIVELAEQLNAQVGQ